MPTTEGEFNLTERLLEIITDLRAENSALLEMLLVGNHLLPKEDVSLVEIPTRPTGLGKLPWYQRKARLEQIFRKPKVSEITGIPETDMQTDFDKNADIIKELNHAREVS